MQNPLAHIGDPIPSHHKFPSASIQMFSRTRSSFEAPPLENPKENPKININFNIQKLNVYNGHVHPQTTTHYEIMGRSASDSGLNKEEIPSKERRASDNKFVIRQNSNKKLYGSSNPFHGAEARPPSKEKNHFESPHKNSMGFFSNQRPIESLNNRRSPSSKLGLTGYNSNDHFGTTYSSQKGSLSSLSSSLPGSIPTTQAINSMRMSHNSKTSSTKNKGLSEKAGLFKNLSVKSKPGCSQRNIPKTNQDSFVFLPSFDTRKELSLFGILDGHGMFGHHVSQFVKATLPKNIETLLKRCHELNDDNISVALSMAFLQTLEALQRSTIDCFVSGTTAVVCLVTKHKIYCANAGDSRAIMIREEEGTNKWTVEPFSEDHKPDLEREKRRIIQSGGRVEPFRGLAMARSIGDLLAGQVGVTATPEVKIFERTSSDKILIIASDGLWEFFSNEEVMRISVPFYGKNDPEGLCDRLIADSNARWMIEDDVIDDTTVLAVYF